MSLSTTIRFLLYIALVLLITKGLVEGRSLKRRHGHHAHNGHYDLEESVPRELSLRHLERENYNLRVHEPWRRKKENYRNINDELERSLRFGPRRKRQNAAHGTVVIEDEKSFEEQINRIVDDYYQLEVREAQNSSICKYTVYSMKDTTGSRIPRDLEHVVCNQSGTSCQSDGPYCCIQTYRKVEVRYADNKPVIKKIFAGCVCALQLLNSDPRLPIND